MLSYIPLIVIVLGLAIMAVFLLRKKSSGHAAREKAVKESGWEYERGNSAYTISDDPEAATLSFKVKGIIENVSWEIKSNLFLSISNTTYQPNSVFRYEKQLIDNNYFFAVPNFSQNTDFAEKKNYLSYLPEVTVENILEKFKINPALLKNLKLYRSKSDYFNKNFYLYSSDPDVIDKVTGRDTAYYLVNFAEKIKDLKKIPSIIITPQFLEIKLLWTLEKVEDIKAFADFGIALIKNTLF